MKQLKKKTVLSLIAILLMGILVACGEDTTIEDYRELESAFRGFVREAEFTRTEEKRLELLGIEGAVLYITTTYIRADGFKESIVEHHVRDQHGEIVSNTKMIIKEGRVYTKLEPQIQMMLFETYSDGESAGLFELFNISLDYLSIRNLLEHILGGSYYYVRELQTIEDSFHQREELWIGIFEAFTEEELESYLSRRNSVFRIEVDGESIEPFLEGLLQELDAVTLYIKYFPIMMIADIDARLRSVLQTEFDRWLSRSDLTGAWFVVERTKSGENTYHQHIELYIPERVSIIMDSTVAVGESTPITAPSSALTLDEIDQRINAWIMDLLFTMEF